MEFHKETTPIARKQHKCDLCDQTIETKSRYHRQTGKYQGDFFDRCLHIHCNKIIKEFISEQSDNEYDVNWVIYYLIEKYCHGCPEWDGCFVNQLLCDKILKNYVR